MIENYLIGLVVLLFVIVTFLLFKVVKIDNKLDELDKKKEEGKREDQKSLKDKHKTFINSMYGRNGKRVDDSDYWLKFEKPHVILNDVDFEIIFKNFDCYGSSDFVFLDNMNNFTSWLKRNHPRVTHYTRYDYDNHLHVVIKGERE